jgi:hypothetical protein
VEPPAHSSASRIGDARCRWTADMDRELTRLWNAGQPSSVIAESLRVSRGAIMGRASRLGLDRSVGGTPQQEGAAERAEKVFAILKHAAARGERCPHNALLAERFGCGTSTIDGALKLLQAEGKILVQRGTYHRVVTILATGQKTAGQVRRQQPASRAA